MLNDFILREKITHFDHERIPDRILSKEGAMALWMESGAIDFVRDAFGHLKAIAADNGGQALLRSANVARDAGVVDAGDIDASIAAAMTRQWEREKSV